MGYELGYLQEVQAVRVPEGGEKKNDQQQILIVVHQQWNTMETGFRY